MRVFVTGASGFVGRNLIPILLSSGYDVTAAVRSVGSAPPGSSELLVGDLRNVTNWSTLLSGHDVALHLAARVHVMDELAVDPLQEFRTMNVDVTKKLAEGALAAGVKKFLFLSSIKVNGEGGEMPYVATDQPTPEDPYGISKYEAELALANIPNLHFAVIRPVLIYGPTVGGNFERLYRLALNWLPLPLRGIQNRRSLLSVSNLADLVLYLLDKGFESGSVVLASDREAVSTTKLVTEVRKANGIPDWQIWVPHGFLSWLARLLGKLSVSDRILGSLEVVTGSTDPNFDWDAPFSLADELQRIVEAEK